MGFFGKKTELASEKSSAPAADQPAVKTKVDASPSQPAASTPPSPTPEQQAQLDKVMEKAKADAAAILGGMPAAQLGTPSGNVEERTAQAQRDHVPGKMRRDKTFIPEWIYDENDGVTRRVLRHGEIRYALVPADDFLSYTGYGYKFALYDGGSRSGLLERGFLGTGDAIFTRTVQGYCQRGDCFLMWIPIRGWEALDAEDKARVDKQTDRAVGSFYNAGYREGIRTWIEVDGKSIT